MACPSIRTHSWFPISDARSGRMKSSQVFEIPTSCIVRTCLRSLVANRAGIASLLCQLQSSEKKGTLGGRPADCTLRRMPNPGMGFDPLINRSIAATSASVNRRLFLSGSAALIMLFRRLWVMECSGPSMAGAVYPFWIATVLFLFRIPHESVITHCVQGINHVS